jgi:hypothetical protein
MSPPTRSVLRFLRPLARQGDELLGISQTRRRIGSKAGASGEQHEAAANATVECLVFEVTRKRYAQTEFFSVGEGFRMPAHDDGATCSGGLCPKSCKGRNRGGGNVCWCSARLRYVGLERLHNFEVTARKVSTRSGPDCRHCERRWYSAAALDSHLAHPYSMPRPCCCAGAVLVRRRSRVTDQARRDRLRSPACPARRGWSPPAPSTGSTRRCARRAGSHRAAETCSSASGLQCLATGRAP